MVERFSYEAGAKSVPVIPYDLFEAANLFLATGCSPEQVLPLIGLTAAEWGDLRETYRWFPYSLGESYRQTYFGGLDDSTICRLVLPPRWRTEDGAEPNLLSTRYICETVRSDPYIGPFAGCDWPVTFIAAHPEALLCCYTHDGSIVYFDGEPLRNREGKPLDADPASFKAVGGRWLADRHYVYGQGVYGVKCTFYWYVVRDADIETFEALNLRYARDKDRAYYIIDKTIRTKSVDAFRIVPDVRMNYPNGTRDPLHDISVIAADREAVYFFGSRLRGAKPATFRVLGHDYATDGFNVWYLDRKLLINGADTASFTVPGPGEPHVSRAWGTPATDRYRPYANGEPRDPTQAVDEWRPFFEARADLQDWWWHKLVGDPERTFRSI